MAPPVPAALQRVLSRGSALGFRAGSLLARFLLAIVVARLLPPDAFGLFMLLLVTVQMASAMASMDVYAETTRLFLAQEGGRDQVLSRHFSFLLLAAVVAAPLAAAGLYLHEGSASVIVYALVAALVVSEALANDVGRFLAPLGRPLWASAYLFIRQVPPVAALLIADLAGVGLGLVEIVMVLAAFSVAITAASMVWLSRGRPWRFISGFDARWTWAVIRGCALFFAGTILFRALFGLDRFLVSSGTDLATAGVYALYVSFGLGLVSVLEAGVSAWHYPKLVQAVLRGEKALALRRLRDFAIANALSALLLCALAAIAVPLIVRGALGPDYEAGLTWFPLILLGAFLISASLPFHYLVYARRRDVSFVMIYGAALIVMAAYFVMVLSGGAAAEAFALFALVAAAITVGRVIAAAPLIVTLRRESS
ncbi:MAG: lipopolysaccharide biosynthesis protein [Brevundimonas sp.]|uniref:lipopolysaccharide biosynthesis protein n=1 Tax=Brevundimonas sp. TaxID=1871086 RepID=UPI00391C80B9